ETGACTLQRGTWGLPVVRGGAGVNEAEHHTGPRTGSGERHSFDAHPGPMKKLLPLAAILCCALPARAQLTITDSLSTADLASLLEGLNVSIVNLTVNCDPAAHGQFSGISEVPITNGLALSTGRVDDMAGPVGDFAATAIGTPGDADLDVLANGGPTFDACVLEFDCIPLGDTLLFNFSFGSEEYPEFAPSSFNDVFAIWLSGPGIGTPVNVATIPGGIPVSINNVNATTNPAYFVDNEAIPGVDFSYDGFTQNLTAFAVVVPGSTYHFKVAVADVSDGVWDSGVFLEAFSFRSVMGLSTAVHEQEGNGLQVLTGPEATYLLLPSDMSGAMLRVHDISGRAVRSLRASGDRIRLPMDGLPEGIYSAQVLNGRDAMQVTFHHGR
ncbi:MAG: choice-of-anchor L domain-containing protein, partial [Flavobacteriales bacterium]|nr:choice-of-anchor L domain-containing protein [Flavobacteriales bacterium]